MTTIKYGLLYREYINGKNYVKMEDVCHDTLDDCLSQAIAFWVNHRECILLGIFSIDMKSGETRAIYNKEKLWEFCDIADPESWGIYARVSA